MGYLYVVQTSIPKEHEAEYHRLYEKEHIEQIASVKGVRQVGRYKQEWGDGTMTEYLALYEVDDPNLPNTAEWKEKAFSGEWPVKIRPLLTANRKNMFKKIYTR